MSATNAPSSAAHAPLGTQLGHGVIGPENRVIGEMCLFTDSAKIDIAAVAAYATGVALII